jgi:hypothetical protein
MSQLFFPLVAKKDELNPNKIPGGRPQIVRIRVAQFEVDGSVCCSCNFFKGLVLCADISWLFSTSSMNLWWVRAGEELSVFIVGSQFIY